MRCRSFRLARSRKPVTQQLEPSGMQMLQANPLMATESYKHTQWRREPTLGRRSSARATQKSCRCPTEKLSPFSATRASRPSVIAVTASCAGHATLAHPQNSAHA